VKKFSRFVQLLDTTTRANQKVAHLASYFDQAEDEDKLFAVALLVGKRPGRIVSSARLKTWALEESGLPVWLFEESYKIVGDLTETIALLFPPTEQLKSGILSHWLKLVQKMPEMNEQEKREIVTEAWKVLDQNSRFVFNKLITGGFKTSISQKLLVRALSAHTGIAESELAHRLTGNWDPFDTTFEELIRQKDPSVTQSRPYPIYLPSILDFQPKELGSQKEWSAEYQWDGIRTQVIVRKGELYIWSQGEELVTESFPDLDSFAAAIPNGTVLDGELVAWRDDQPMHFKALQKRIKRKVPTPKLIREIPVALLAFDLMEWDGTDIRGTPFYQRRKLLEKLCKQCGHPRLIFSGELAWENWSDLEGLRQNAREHRSDGILLKKRDSLYKSGRSPGEWWKWKADPMVASGVLLYAMRGRGLRTNLITDYTFGVWDRGSLVPFAKANSGLTEDEFRSITQFIRRNTLERHGPVYEVKPELVFEIAFEGIAPSNRTKSGLSVKHPRIQGWLKDKPPEEVTSLKELKELL
jgi:DNA ligase 1